MKALLFTLCTLACVLALCFLFFQIGGSDKNRFVSGLRASFEESLRTSGPVLAYAEMKKSVLKKTHDEQHNAAHLFGESLYAVEGVNGIRICDTDFNFGCYHGFFTKAVSGEGLSSVGALDAACQTSERPSACQHGIGHGIMEYVGHSNLSRALEACSLAYQPDPIAGCTSGVFMDYNIRLTVEGNTFSVSARPLGNPELPYAPCTDVEDRFKKSCYHELPQWWYQVYQGDIQNIGALCERIEDKNYRAICFGGVGNIVGSVANYETALVKELCALMPKHAVTSCITHAAWSFSANIDAHGDAKELCENVVSEEEKIECLKHI